MGLTKKSSPRPSHSEAKQIARQHGAPLRKSETKVVPDSSDSVASFISQAPVSEEPQEEGQLNVDVFQTADEIVIVAPVAGVRPSDLSITITDEVLTIKGKRNFQFNVESTDYFTQECFWGNFARSVILPDAVDASGVKASFKDGVLAVSIPKIERIKTRMVKIMEE